MKCFVALSLGLVLLGGCGLPIPNGLFGCGQQSDCPSGYFCWSADSRCYDAQEPGCEPKECEQVIGEFASLGIPIECGSLPDGCEGSIECGGCPSGTQCGANGQNFMCGCEELTCATLEKGAECGTIQTRCGGPEQALDCGECFGQQVCVDNKCVCPTGVDCNMGCGACDDGEVCVDGECCAPTFPCSHNECSPPGGLDDGCGGQAQCPPCSMDEQCVLSDDLTFECLGECTCRAQDVECGSANICGQPRLCGSCQDNGFDDGFRCSGGECICDDAFEYNDTVDNFALLCTGLGGINCLQDAWRVDLQATLHDEPDIDYYALEALDSETLLVANIMEGAGDYTVHMTYFCPDGDSGIDGCSGSSETLAGTKFCVSDDGFVGLMRGCKQGILPGKGMVLVSVRATEFRDMCDPYQLEIFATYGTSEAF